jgi:hypothetical protein
MFYYWMVCNIHEHERSCIFVISVPILPLSTSLLLNFGTVPTVWYFLFFIFVLLWIRVITKLPNTEQSSKGKSKTHKSTNRQNQSTTGKLGKPQWLWLGTGISKEIVGWIGFYGAKPPASITVKRNMCRFLSAWYFFSGGPHWRVSISLAYVTWAWTDIGLLTLLYLRHVFVIRPVSPLPWNIGWLYLVHTLLMEGTCAYVCICHLSLTSALWYFDLA